MRAFQFLMVLGSCLLAPAGQANAIHDAVKQGNVAAISAALKAGADVNGLEDGAAPLYIAAMKGNLEAARLLVEHGADVNVPAKFGTPLYAAAKFGHADVVALLLTSGAKPNQTTRSLTALHMGAGSGCMACVIHLVEAGADVNALTSERQPAIHFAKQHGHDNIARYLLDHGAEKLVVPPVTPLLADADPKLGKELFADSCHGCHALPGEVNRNIAPDLYDVIGRERAATTGFIYSPALREAGGIWTYEAINVFISDPARAIPGTAMAFHGLHDENQRAKLIAFLRTLSDIPPAAAVPMSPN